VGGGGGHTGQTGQETAGQESAGGFGGASAQPTSTIAARMWVVYLEMGLALALAIFIIWWTRPRKPRDDDQ